MSFQRLKVFILIAAVLVMGEKGIAASRKDTRFLSAIETHIQRGDYLRFYPYLKKLNSDPVFQKSPDYARGLYYMAWIYDLSGISMKAEKILKRALKFTKKQALRDRILMRLSAIFAKEGRYDESLKVYKKVKVPLRGELDVLIEIAKVLVLYNRFNEAVKILLKLKKEGEETGKVLFVLGAAYAGMEDYDKAIKYFSQARIVTKSKYIADLASIQIARALNDMGRFSEALSVYATVTSDSLKDIVRSESAWMLYKLGNLEEALQMTESISRTASNTAALLDANILKGYIISEQQGYLKGWLYLKSLLERYEQDIELLTRTLKKMRTWEYTYSFEIIRSTFPKRARVLENILSDAPSLREYEEIFQKIRKMFYSVDALFTSLVTFEDKVHTMAQKNVMEKVRYADSIRERLLELKLAPVVERTTYTERNIYERLRNYRRELLAIDRRLRVLIKKIYDHISELENQLRQGENPRIINKYNIYAAIAHKAVKTYQQLGTLLDESMNRLDYILSLYSIKYNIKTDPRIKKIDRMLSEIDEIKREILDLWKVFNTSVILKTEKLKNRVKTLRLYAQAALEKLKKDEKYFHYLALGELRNEIINELARVELAYTDVSWAKKNQLSEKIGKLYERIEQKQHEEEVKVNKAIKKIEKTATTIDTKGENLTEILQHLVEVSDTLVKTVEAAK